MNTRLMACAFLQCGNEILLMHRGPHRRIAPNMWSGVGGHMEMAELNNPLATCLREIEEEAGIAPDAITALRLRYIAIRNVGGEITQSYHFFGEVSEKPDLPFCDEGSFHWIPAEEIANLEMSFSVKQVALHWLAHQREDDIYLLGVNHDNNAVNWTRL